jgi:uncharacterized membrane protein
MDRMLVVVFDNEAKAFQGKNALVDLNLEGGITLYAYGVLVKSADGTVTVKQTDGDIPIRTLLGTALGSFIGLVGGPVGMGVGATVGLTAGGVMDLYHAGIGEDFLDDVGRTLTPGKVAIVAEVDEDWTTPVDQRMEAIGGTVLRRSLSTVRHTLHEEEVASMKADLAQMKAEMAQARAERKAKLMDKMTQLDSKIQARLQKAKDKRLEAEQRDQEKVRKLQERASAARAKAS